MVKLYRSPNGHPLNISVWTDAKDERTFITEITDTVTRLVAIHSNKAENDMGFTLSGQFEKEVQVILQHSFEILCKMRGYKSDFVSEQRALLCGAVEPDDRHALYLDTVEQSLDVEIEWAKKAFENRMNGEAEKPDE